MSYIRMGNSTSTPPLPLSSTHTHTPSQQLNSSISTSSIQEFDEETRYGFDEYCRRKFLSLHNNTTLLSCPELTSIDVQPSQTTTSDYEINDTPADATATSPQPLENDTQQTEQHIPQNSLPVSTIPSSSSSKSSSLHHYSWIWTLLMGMFFMTFCVAFILGMCPNELKTGFVAIDKILIKIHATKTGFVAVDKALVRIRLLIPPSFCQFIARLLIPVKTKLITPIPTSV